MDEELGRITRPASDNYQGKRKLLLAPLAQLPGAAEQLPADGVEALGRYWEQVDTQVRAVQNALGSVARVYHESLPEGGAAGAGVSGGDGAAEPSAGVRAGGGRGDAGVGGVV